MKPEILNYIKEARQHGLSEPEIKQNLLNVGWDSAEIEDTFSYAKIPGNSAEPIQQMPATQQSPAIQQPLTVQQHPIAPATRNQQTAIHTEAITPPVLQPAISDAGSINPAPKKNRAWIFAISAIIILAGLGAGGYFAYGFYFPNVQKVWQNAVLNAVKSGKIYTVDYNFSFADPVNGTNDNTNKIGGSLSGNAFVNGTKPDFTEFDTKFNIAYDYSGMNSNKNFEAMFKDQAFYIDISSIPEITSFFGQPLTWIKLDYKELQDFASSTGNFSVEKQSQVRNTIQEDLQTQWKSNPPITAVKILGSETVSGVSTYHIQNQFNKDAFADLVFKTYTDVDKIYEPNSASPAISDQEKQDFKNQLAKLNFKTLETWVGKKDSQIYKINIDILAPSYTAASDVVQGNAGDLKRIGDMRQMSAALEMYFNDNNGYPASQNGTPQNLSPKYIGLVPTAPTPPGSNCNDYYNTYWYTASGTPNTQNNITVYPSYELTFCLGNDTGSYKAGIHTLSPFGISDTIACTAQMGNCPSIVAPTPSQKPQEPQSETKITLTFSDIGKQKDINPPNNATDILQIVQSALGTARSKSRDAKRIADMRQLGSAEELFFNDHSKYASNLPELVPQYLGAVPSAQEPADGTCSEEQNAYTYIPKKDGSNYTFNFCLGADSGPYKAGPHILTNAGIQ